MASNDTSTVTHVLEHGPHKSEVGQKQLTLALAGQYIATTTPTITPRLVWELESTFYARYYLPVDSLHTDITEQLSGVKSNNTHATPLKLPISVEVIDTIEAKNGSSKALVEKLNVGRKTTTWVRFVGGDLDGLIRFEREEIGESA